MAVAVAIMSLVPLGVCSLAVPAVQLRVPAGNGVVTRVNILVCAHRSSAVVHATLFVTVVPLRWRRLPVLLLVLLLVMIIIVGGSV